MDAPENVKADGSELLSIPIPDELSEDALKRLRATEESYMKVPQILATLSPEANIKVFEGLPNPIFREQFNDEIANNQTALRHGFHFYLAVSYRQNGSHIQREWSGPSWVSRPSPPARSIHSPQAMQVFHWSRIGQGGHWNVLTSRRVSGGAIMNRVPARRCMPHALNAR